MTPRNFLPMILLFVTGFVSVQAQSSQYDKGTPPQHAAGVSSLGSYMSTELGTVNLSNGGLNINIPLGTVGGRGNVAVPLTLSYSSKVWSASTDVDTERESGTEQQVAYADYDNQSSFAGASAPGWTLRTGMYMSVRFVRIKRIMSGPSVGCYTYGLHKLTLNLPDKGEVEFRDDATDGAPLALNCNTQQTASRGSRWHATDGSGAIFINDVDNGVGLYPSPNLSGTIIFADGTRFGTATSGAIVDRNGNKITGTFNGYIDQLGRTTTVDYGVTDPDNPAITLAALITIPGYQGATRYYKVKTGIMRLNYRNGVNPTLPVITGDWDPEGWGYNWGTATRLYLKSYGLYAQRIDDREVLTEVVLPDGRSLKFRYNEFGEVAEMELPTGGKIQYDYAYRSALPTGNSPSWEVGTNGAGSGIVTDVKFVDRAVTAKRTYADGVNLEGTWTFGYASKVINSVQYPSTLVSASSSTGTLLSRHEHIFLQAGRYTEPYNSLSQHDGTHYNLWSTGVEWRTESLDAAGNVLAATEQDWTQRSPVSWSSYPQEQPSKDNRVNQARRYLETGMMAKVETSYDQYNNPIEVKEYDYDQTLKRRTTTTYLSTNNGFNYQADDSIHLMRLPSEQTIYDGSGNQVAKTTTEYDVYTNDGNRNVLTGYPSVSQHDSGYGTTKTTRGNPTRIGVWRNTTASFIYTYPRYDIVGNVVSLKDARGNVSTISFADDFGNGSNPGTPSQNPATPTYSLPTLITSPPPVPGAPVHTARSQYDYSTGLLTGFRDRNNVVTQTLYNDPFNRPTLVKSALGISGVESHSVMCYAPGASPCDTISTNETLIATDQTTLGDRNLRSWTVTDGFGRTKEAWQSDPQGNVKATTIYDALSRTKQASNPFRPSLGEAEVFTTTSYDLLGRLATVTGPDNSVVSTSYSANTVTVTDQASKKRKSVTDALGRLKEVYEDPTGLNYLTSYQYDTLDNLVTVTQGTQTRSFSYNSLKQLLSANNPESGTTSYQYDDAANLLAKTDARGVSAHYAYDAFSRVTRRWYNGSSAVSDTAHNLPALPGDVGTSNEANYFYDLQALPSGAPSFSRGAANGRLVGVTYGTNSSTGDYIGYDAVGRNTLKIQRTGSVNYQMSASLNIAGEFTSVIYPSGRNVNYTYDVVGRASSVVGTLGDGTSRNYSTELNYNPEGGLTREKFGTSTPVYHKLRYNVRRQLCDVRASNVNDVSGGELGTLSNYYSTNGVHCSSGSDNNGNLLKSQTIINSFSVEDRYTYDGLNRITSFSEYQNGTTQTGLQEYEYDRWGNRTIKPTTWGVGINNKQFTVNTANNRLGVPVGQSGTMTYDVAGNLTNDTYTGAGNRTYDAENKITSAWGGNNQAQLYAYDSSGQRIKRTVDGVEVWQVYGFGGELMAEYPVNGAPVSPQKEYGHRNGQLLVTATINSSAGGSPPTSGLAGYWRFDENSGTTAADWSGNNNTGTLTSGATWGTGQSGAATSLDGTNDYVQMGAPSSLVLTTAGSLSAWIHPTGPGSLATYGGVIIGKEGEYQVARFTDGTIQWAFANTNPGWNWVNTGSVAPLNQWTHVAVTYDNGVVQTYINGTLTHTYSGTGAIGDTNTTWNDFRVGGRQGNSQHFQGRIDEVRVYNRALSAGEVATLPISTPSGLAGYWRFDENSGTTAADSSGNNNTGTLTSGAVWGAGQSGAATSLDGVNDYVQMGAPSSLVLTNAGSLSGWIYPTGPGSLATYGGVIIAKEGEYQVARFTDGTIQWAFANTNPGWNWVNTGYVAPLNQWTHVAVTYDNGVVTTYINGTLTHTYSGTGAIGDTNTTWNDFRVGGRQANSQHFQGRIDEVRVYNRALSAGEVATLPSGTGFGSTQISWLVADHLGTPRMVIDQTGSLANIKRHDYLPFGEELFAPSGGRTIQLGYSGGDGIRQQFTSKERDVETGLDYFLTRYYSSAQGRFTSYDVIFVTARRLLDPQLLNLFAYARNNPLKFIDPDGMDVILTGKTEQEARDRFNVLLMGLKPKDRPKVEFFVGDGKDGYEKGQFYVRVDQKHKSDSENFQALQTGANDRTADARLSVLNSGDSYTLRYISIDNNRPVLTSLSGTFQNDFHGYTLFEYRGLDEESYSAGSYTEVLLNGALDNIELSATMHHEIRAHVLLGDFGRSVPKARHSDPYARGQGPPTSEADKVGEAAEKEARQNAKKKP